MSHVNSHSTSAVNNIDHSVVDFGRSPSPSTGLAPTSRSHSPLPRKCYKRPLSDSSNLNVIYFIPHSFSGLESSSRYASSNVLAAVPPGTPRAVSTEDITRFVFDSNNFLYDHKIAHCERARGRRRRVFSMPLRLAIVQISLAAK